MNAATRNEAGRHVYHCADCGQECTVNTPGGPATTDTDGVTRCRECAPKADTKRARLNDAAPSMLEALRACFVNGDPAEDFRPGALTVRMIRAAIAKAEGETP